MLRSALQSDRPDDKADNSEQSQKNLSAKDLHSADVRTTSALVDLSDSIVSRGERLHKKLKQRTFLKTMVCCAAHSNASSECLMRQHGFYRIGKQAIAVEDSRHGLNREIDRRDESQRQRHYGSRFVDDDEALLLQRYVDRNCVPMVADVYDRSPSTSTSETNEEIDSMNKQSAAVKQNTNNEPDQVRYACDSYVCYILQSLSNPSRTYVGVTNNRFKRLRQHNGEIVGGAKATRAYRPHRMIGFIDGFGSNKVAALRFEWSMHNPRKRRLERPYTGVAGRINCAKQLFASATWCNTPLRFWSAHLLHNEFCFSQFVAPINIADDATKSHLMLQQNNIAQTPELVNREKSDNSDAGEKIESGDLSNNIQPVQ